MTKFLIPVRVYGSRKPGKEIAIKRPLFEVSDRKLIVAMVRSILTANADRPSRKYMAAIVRPTLDFLLDWSEAPRLRISTEFVTSIRDFSLTARIGELAQAVSFAYWNWHRGYSWITDFKPWASGLTPSYTGAKSPDFVMLKTKTRKLSVMEAKGTMSHCHKRPMRIALKQCEDAVKHPAFNRGYGTVLTLDSDSLSGTGTLHIRDPALVAHHSDRLLHYIFQRSYASWFELTGETNRAKWCRRRFQEYESFGKYFEQEAVEEDLLRDTTTAALGFNPARTQYRLSAMVEDALIDIRAFVILIRSSESESFFPVEEVVGKGIWFPDGTSIEED